MQQQKIKEIEETDLVLVEVSKREEGEDILWEDKPYYFVKKELASRGMCTQMFTEKTIDKARDWVGKSFALNVFSKLKGVPWVIKDMPGNVDLFIGLDLSRKDGISYSASAFLFKENGELLKWKLNPNIQKGEKIKREALRKLIKDAIKSLLEMEKDLDISKIVLHRDGFLYDDEKKVIEETFDELRKEGIFSSLEYVLVSVRKKGAPRILKKIGDLGFVILDKGIIVKSPFSGSEETYYLLTTGADEYSNLVQNPVTVEIRGANCDYNPFEIVEQVFWLSEMHWGTTRSTRLPTTTLYADKAASFLREGVIPSKNLEDTLWFL